MFSGIIARVGRVVGIAEAGSGSRLSIETGFADLELGESVALDGVCLTVAALSGVGTMEVFAVPRPWAAPISAMPGSAGR